MHEQVCRLERSYCPASEEGFPRVCTEKQKESACSDSQMQSKASNSTSDDDASTDSPETGG